MKNYRRCWLQTMKTKFKDPNHFLLYLLVGIALSLISFSLLVSSPRSIISGLTSIILHPDSLITDYLVIGGVGAAFFNAGLVASIFIYMIYRFEIKISGLTFASIFLLIGFSFLGKNIVNIWSIILGVYLYTAYHKQKFSHYIYVAIFATAMSPIVTEIIFHLDTSLPIRLVSGLLLGVGLGFTIPPLSTHFLRTHQGYNLYNVGFTAGIIITILVALFKSFGFVPTTQLIWGTEFNALLAPFLYLLFGSFVILGFMQSKEAFTHYRKLFAYSGRLVTDFFALEHMSGTLVNMGLNGILSTTFVLLVGGHLNGPTMGGIFTIVGFSAFGKHIKNIWPITMGVFLSTFVKGFNIADPSIILAALFATGLAPIAGQFGAFWGIVAGFLHLSVTLHVSPLHSGFNLYSNGFAAGLVAAVLIPLIESFRKEHHS